MPNPPLPEPDDHDATTEEPKTSSVWPSEIRMRWKQPALDDGEPELLEISIGASWASMDLGRHVAWGIIDVELEAPDVIDEAETPAPDGTPVPLGASGQILVTCELGGAVFDA